MNSVLIMAHEPLAQALRQAALHVFPDAAPDLMALDVRAGDSPEVTLGRARQLLSHQTLADGTLVLADVFGATPCNVAQKLVDGARVRLVAGANLPMLLRALTYRQEPLEVLASRVVAGGSQGVMQVAVSAPHNQSRRIHDQNHHDHQQ